MNNKLMKHTLVVAVVLLLGIAVAPGFKSWSIKKAYPVNNTNTLLYPLYEARIKKDVDTDSPKTVHRFYLGQDKEITLTFPFNISHMNKLDYYLKYIALINNNNLLNVQEKIMFHLKKYYSFSPKMIDQIVTILTDHQMKPTPLKNNAILMADTPTTSPFYTFCNWFPGCIPYLIISSISMMIWLIFFIIESRTYYCY